MGDPAYHDKRELVEYYECCMCLDRYDFNDNHIVVYQDDEHINYEKIDIKKTGPCCKTNEPMKKEIIINYEWNVDEQSIGPVIKDALITHATSVINEATLYGFSEGELSVEINDVEYYGSWKVKKLT